jgi:glutaredoxin 3
MSFHFRHRQLYLSTYLPWALQAGHNSSFLLNVYFEERWHQPIQEMRQELSLPDPPQAAGTNPYDIRLLKSQPDQSNELNKSSKSDCSLQEKVKKWIFDERKPVVIFSKTFCPYCHKVKELFKQLSIDCQVIELDRLPDGQAVQEVLSSISGQESLPNVFIHGNHVGGCDATIKLYEEGKLLPMVSQFISSFFFLNSKLGLSISLFRAILLHHFSQMKSLNLAENLIESLFSDLLACLNLHSLCS